MADMQLVGAVGVRVRPDAKNFRRDAKNEIMAQMRDLEAEYDVKVKPDVKYDEAMARQTFRDAFKDLTVDQKITVKPNVDDQAFKDAVNRIMEKALHVDDPTEVRIGWNAKEAEAGIAKYTDKIENLKGELSSLPSVIKDLQESHSKTFDKLVDDQERAKDSLRTLETAADQAKTAALERASEARTARLLESEAIEALGRADATRHAADMEFQRLKLATAEETDAVRKKELRELRIEANQTLKLAEKQYRAAAQNRKDAASQLEQMTKAHAKSEDSLAKVNSKLNEQRRHTDALAKRQHDITQEYLEQKMALDEQHKANLISEEDAQRKLALLEAQQAAMAKSFRELEGGIYQSVHSWDDYRVRLKKGMTQAGNYIAYLKEVSKETHGQLGADLDEYLKRIEEFGKKRRAIAEKQAEFDRRNEMNGLSRISPWGELTNFDQALNAAQDFADDAARYIERKRPKMEIQVDVDRASFTSSEGLLDFLARDRNVTMKPTVSRSRLILGDVDPIDVDADFTKLVSRAKAASKDIGKAFSGIGIAQRLHNDLFDAIRDFDDLAIAAGRSTVLITGALSTVTAGLGAAALISSDLGKIINGLLLGPSSVVALGTMVYATMKGFEGFGAAVDGDAEALATFGAAGRDAANAVGRLKREVQTVTRARFWEGLGTDLGDMARAVREPMVAGMGQAAEEIGEIWAGLFRSLRTFAESGDMAEAFEGMNEGLRNLSRASEPFLDAINAMGLAGSRHLPRIGDAAARNAEKFRDWAQAAEESGQMNDWISEAGRNLGDLLSVTSSTVDIIGSLGRAAENAGFGGLRTLAQNMEAVADAADNPFFQGNMANIFQGSLEFVEEFAEGFGNLGEAILDQSGWVEELQGRIGRTMKNILTEIADSFNNSRFLEGVQEMFADVEEASEGLGPLMDMLATGVGDTARLVGEIIKGALEIAEAFLHVWTNSDHLVRSLERLIPYLTDLLASFIRVAHAPIDMLTEALAFLIDGFMALPEPVRNGVLALAALAAVAPKIRAIGLMMTGLRSSFTNANGAIGGFRNTWQTAMSTMSSSGRTFMTTSRLISAQDRAVARAAFAWRDFARTMGGGQSFGVARSNMQGLVRELRNVERAQLRTTDMINRSNGRNLNNLTRTYERNAQAISRIQGQIATASRASWAGASTLAVAEGRKILTSLRDQRTALGSLRAAAGATSFAPFVSSLRTVREQSGQAARALASSAAGSLRSGISSVSQALGGPWMIGFMVAAIAVMDLVSTVKKSQGAFDEMTTSIEDFGSKGEEVASQLEQAFDRDIVPVDKWGTQFNNWWDDFEPLRDNLIEAMDEVGLSSKDMSTAMTGSSEEYSDALGKIQGAHDKLWNNKSSAIAAMEEMRAEYIRASVESKNYAASMGITEEGAVKLRSAMEVLRDGTGDASTEINAMRTSLDVLHGGQISAMQSAMDLASAQDQVKTDLKEIVTAATDSGQSIKDLFKVLGDGTVELDATKSLSRDLASAMTEWGDAALSSGKQVYDAAIQSGKGHQEAARLASESMDGTKKSMRGVLEDIGYTTGEANALLTTFTGRDWELELTFMGRTDDFLEAKGLVEAAGNEIDGKNFVAFLKANPGTSTEEIRNLAKAGMTWEESEFTAEFGATSIKFDEKLRDAIARGKTFSDEDMTAHLKGDDTPFLESVLHATQAGMDLEGEEFKATFGGNTNPLLASIADAEHAGEEIGSAKWVATIDANNEGFAEAFLVAEAKAKGFEGDKITAHVTANIGEYSANLSQAEQLKMNLSSTAATVSVDAETDVYFLKLRMVELAAQGLNNTEIRTKLGLNTEEWDVLMDGTMEGILKSYDDKNAEATVGVEGAEESKTKVKDVNDELDKTTTKNPTASVTVMGVPEAKSGTKGVNDELDETGRKNPTASMSITGDLDAKTRTKAVNDELDKTDTKAPQASVFVEAEKAKADAKEVNEALDEADLKNADPSVTLGGSPAQVREDLDHIQRKLDDIDNKNPDANVTVTGASQALTDLQGVVDKMTGLSGKTATATITAVGAIQAQANTQRVIDRLNALSGKTASGRVIVTGAEAANAQIASVANAMSNLGTRQAHPRVIFQGGPAAIGQIDSVIAKMNVLNGTRANPRVTFLGGPAAIGQIDAVLAKLRTLNGTTARPKIDQQGHTDAQSKISATQRLLNTLGNTTTHPNITLYGSTIANSEINGVRNNLQSLDGDVATVTIRTVRTGENANGSITMFADGGILGAFNRLNDTMGRAVQVFAKGGFSGGQTFADGGVTSAQIYAELAKRPPGYKENHIAQIASSKTPFRIWAEPETSPGEAYIPLASSKRTRSTRIWEETGKLLGVDWESYADGGTSGTRGSGFRGSSSSPRRTDKVINVNVTNHYPVAEPTSVTTNRSLQFAANL